MMTTMHTGTRNHPPCLHLSLPAFRRNIKRMIWSAGMLHRTRTSLMLRNLLSVFVITNCILSLGHLASSLLNASRVKWIALVELWKKFIFLRLKLGAFSISAALNRGRISVVDVYVAAFHFSTKSTVRSFVQQHHMYMSGGWREAAACRLSRQF